MPGTFLLPSDLMRPSLKMNNSWLFVGHLGDPETPKMAGFIKKGVVDNPVLLKVRLSIVGLAKAHVDTFWICFFCFFGVSLANPRKGVVDKHILLFLSYLYPNLNRIHPTNVPHIFCKFSFSAARTPSPKPH